MNIQNENMQELEIVEANLQNLIVQKHNLQSQLLELDSAIDELKTSKESFKIIGNIIVKESSKNLASELTSKRELYKKRFETVEKQEKQFRQKFQELQEEVLKNNKNKKNEA